MCDSDRHRQVDTMTAWDHVEDLDLRAWLLALPEGEQLELAGRNLDTLDRARGDALMAEVIASTPPRVPFPPGWDDMTDAEQVSWWNGPFKLAMAKLIDADRAARRAAEEVEP